MILPKPRPPRQPVTGGTQRLPVDEAGSVRSRLAAGDPDTAKPARGCRAADEAGIWPVSRRYWGCVGSRSPNDDRTHLSQAPVSVG
jgi:hypothetical protein